FRSNGATLLFILIMQIITKHLRDAKIAKALLRNAPKTVLCFHQRRRSRQRIALDNGDPAALMLHQGTILRHGDVLVTKDGQLILVEAAVESVLRISADHPQHLTRAAYHLGNRHTLVEVGSDYLQLEYDAVLIAMLQQLGGLAITQMQAAFEPDVGAYGKGHKHGHEDSFAEDYALAQAAYAAHEPPGHHDHAHEHS